MYMYMESHYKEFIDTSLDKFNSINPFDQNRDDISFKIDKFLQFVQGKMNINENFTTVKQKMTKHKSSLRTTIANIENKTIVQRISDAGRLQLQQRVSEAGRIRTDSKDTHRMSNPSVNTVPTGTSAPSVSTLTESFALSRSKRKKTFRFETKRVVYSMYEPFQVVRLYPISHIIPLIFTFTLLYR